MKINFTKFFAIVLIFSSSLFAQQLIYQPVNPSFGGNPLNGNWMLANAQAQDKTGDTGLRDLSSDPFADFQQNLNRSVLNLLSRQLVDNAFGQGQLQPGQYEIGNFFIEVTEVSEGLQIFILDNLTGNQTTITIPGLGGG